MNENYLALNMTILQNKTNPTRIFIMTLLIHYLKLIEFLNSIRYFGRNYTDTDSEIHLPTPQDYTDHISFQIYQQHLNLYSMYVYINPEGKFSKPNSDLYIVTLDIVTFLYLVELSFFFR